MKVLQNIKLKNKSEKWYQLSDFFISYIEVREMISIIYYNLVSLLPLSIILDLFSALMGVIVGSLAFIVAGIIVFKIID